MNGPFPALKRNDATSWIPSFFAFTSINSRCRTDRLFAASDLSGMRTICGPSAVRGRCTVRFLDKKEDILIALITRPRQTGPRKPHSYHR